MNARLAVGGALLILLFGLAIFGPQLAPYALSDSTKVKTVQTEDGLEIYGAPFPPSSEHVFGTNEWGYDILTLLLYGARYSVFCVLAVALTRILVGSVLGLLLGMYSARIKPLNVSALGGVPAFLIIYFCMFGININSTLSSVKLAVIQAVLLSILGIPGIVSVISSKTVELQKQPFILAAKSCGVGKARLAFRHILPMLKENLVIMLVHEAITTLNTLGQLGIFNLFLGGTIFTPNPMLFHSVSHEWAGLVGQSRPFIASSQWILLFPLLSFVLALAALYLFSRGLEDHYHKKYQPFSYV